MGGSGGCILTYMHLHLVICVKLMLISSLWHQRVVEFWSFGVYCMTRFSFWSHHCTKASLEINNLKSVRRERKKETKKLARTSARISNVLVRKLIGFSRDFMIFLDLIFFPVSSWHWSRATDPLSRQSPSSLFWNVPTWLSPVPICDSTKMKQIKSRSNAPQATLT